MMQDSTISAGGGGGGGSAIDAVMVDSGAMVQQYNDRQQQQQSDARRAEQQRKKQAEKQAEELQQKQAEEQQRLKELEKESCALFTEEAYDEIPNWSYTLEFEGYLCRYIDSEQHVTQYGTSEEWQQENYQKIKEFYYINKLKPESIN